MSFSKLTLASLLLGAVRGQQVGTLTTETHPTLNSQKCVTGGTCTTQDTSITLDSNWRWLHSTSGSTNCYTGNTWDSTLCPDGETCAKNCAIDGADYENTYGITASGSSLEIKFVTDGAYSTNIGSRVYLMADESTYQMFSLKNQEFTFDVDVSNLPCGLNGALYFVSMSADGGMSAYDGNKAGAKYGTGYCDSQCPHDIKFINGEANVGNWTPSANDDNAGTGQYGSCCDEMDIWEANSMSTAFTPHPCTSTGQTRCEGTECGGDAGRYAGVCDPDGCDFNSYRLGNTTFFGAGKTVDTSSVFTVVTQFITDDGTANGTLSEIRRIYVQDGVVIQNSAVDVPNVDPVNSITDDFCTAIKAEFNDTNSFATAGGLTKMGTALEDMVLVMSLWDDHTANMLWLDSDYPVDSDASTLGVSRGSCATSSGVPSDVESNNATASVTFSNIKFGDLNSTYTV